jgi:hypothetical protein
MNSEEIKAATTAIAEWEGWREAFPQNKDAHPETKKGGILLPYKWVNENTHERTMQLPNYSTSLDAIQSVVMRLSPDQFSSYLRHLDAITGSEYRFEVENRFALVNAIAAQRAEGTLADH